MPSFAGPESLLFSFENDNLSNLNTEHGSASLTQKKDLQVQIQALMASRSLFHVRLLRLVRLAASRIPYQGAIANEVLANELARQGYQVAVRRGEGGGSGTQCFKNLRHSFLKVEDQNSTDSFIVELAFRDHFVISHQSSRYRALLDMVPQVVVAHPDELGPLIDLISKELTRAFAAAGLDVPPWRQSRSMLSKWLPKKAQDTSLSTTGLAELASGALHCDTRHEEPGAYDLGSELGSPTSPWRGVDSEEPSGGSPRAVLPGPEDEVVAGKPSLYFGGEGRKPRSMLSWNLAAQPAPLSAVPGLWKEPSIRVVHRAGSRRAMTVA